MKQMIAALVALAAAGACTSTPSPGDDVVDPDADAGPGVDAEPGEAAWPCGARSGDVDTRFEYDDLNRITHERRTRGSALVAEVTSSYRGDVEFRREEHDVALDDVAITERDVIGGLVTAVRFTSSYWADYREAWAYQNGRLSRVDGVVAVSGGLPYSREYLWGNAGTVTIVECFQQACGFRTQTGGDPWTHETLEGPGRSVHDRTFGAHGELLVETKVELGPDDVQTLVLHREVQRKPNGAPLSETVETRDGVEDIEYLYRCAP